MSDARHLHPKLEALRHIDHLRSFLYRRTFNMPWYANPRSGSHTFEDMASSYHTANNTQSSTMKSSLSKLLNRQSTLPLPSLTRSYSNPDHPHIAQRPIRPPQSHSRPRRACHHRPCV